MRQIGLVASHELGLFAELRLESQLLSLLEVLLVAIPLLQLVLVLMLLLSRLVKAIGVDDGIDARLHVLMLRVALLNELLLFTVFLLLEHEVASAVVEGSELGLNGVLLLLSDVEPGRHD